MPFGDIRECAICEQPIEEGSFFESWGVFFPMEDPLYPFCNASIHWDCYEKWPHRARFARKYIDMFVEAILRIPFWSQVDLTTGYFLEVNPQPWFSAVDLMLYETGSQIRIKLSDWDTWISDETAVLEGRHPCEQKALKKVLPELQRRFPTAESILNAIGV
jgi:hypothetical protein